MKKQYLCKYGVVLGMTEAEAVKARKKRENFYRHLFSVNNWNEYKRKKLFPASHSALYYSVIAREEAEEAARLEVARIEAEKLISKEHVPTFPKYDGAILDSKLCGGLHKYNAIDDVFFKNAYAEEHKISGSGFYYDSRTITDKPLDNIPCKLTASAAKIDFSKLPIDDKLEKHGDKAIFDAFDEAEAKREAALKRAKARGSFTRTKFKKSRKADKPLTEAAKDRIAEEAILCGESFKYDALANDIIASAEAWKHEEALIKEYGACIIPRIAAKREEVYNVFALLEAEEKAANSTFTRKAYKEAGSNAFIEAALNCKLAERITYKALMRLYCGFVNKKTGALQGGTLEALRLAYGYNMPVNKEDFTQEVLLYLWEASLNGEAHVMTEEEAEEAREEGQEAEAGKLIFDGIAVNRIVRNAMHNYKTKHDKYRSVHSIVDEEVVNKGYIDANLLTLDNDIKGFLHSYFVTTCNMSAQEAALCLRLAVAIACGYKYKEISLYLNITKRQIDYRIAKAIKPALLYFCGGYTTKSGKVLFDKATMPNKPRKDSKVNYKALMRA